MHVSMMHVSVMHESKKNDARIHGASIGDTCIQETWMHDACVHDTHVKIIYAYLLSLILQQQQEWTRVLWGWDFTVPSISIVQRWWQGWLIDERKIFLNAGHFILIFDKKITFCSSTINVNARKVLTRVVDGHFHFLVHFHFHIHFHFHFYFQYHQC